MGAEIQGTKPHGNWFDQAMRVVGSRVNDRYDADAFSIGIVSNQSLKNRGGSTLFVNVPVAHRLVFKADGPVTVKLRSSTNPGIPVPAFQQFEPTWCEFSDIFITTSNANTNIQAIIV